MSSVLSSVAVPDFAGVPAFSLGVEEELLLVAPGTYAPGGGADAVLERVAPGPGSVVGEINDDVIELVTAVCTTAAEAVDALRSLRRRVTATGATLIGAGLHPDGRHGEVTHRSGERYELISNTMRGLMRQTPHCGVHVHVGMPDGETAIRACNGMRKWIPLLQALAANSPYWYGRDSGLASARAVICNSLPRAGVPREFRDYDDYVALVEEVSSLGECRDYSLAWWDLRPHPRLGTLEVRAFDAQSSLDDLAALVALTHCLAVHEAQAEPVRGPSPEVLRETCFRACRDGLDATLPHDGSLLPARQLAMHAYGLAGTHAAELGCWDEIELLPRLLERGNGAVRQRTAAAAGGLPALLGLLAAETSPARSPGGRFVLTPWESAQPQRGQEPAFSSS